MKKNDVVTMEIEDFGINGEGIGRIEGYTLFVKDAVIGDLVEVKVMKAKKNYGYGKLIKVIRPSKYRAAPRCPIARQCGGCQIQEVSYEKQLEYKNQKVLNNLKRIGKIPEETLEAVMEEPLGMEEPYRYRNKAQFPIGRDNLMGAPSIKSG